MTRYALFVVIAIAAPGCTTKELTGIEGRGELVASRDRDPETTVTLSCGLRESRIDDGLSCRFADVSADGVIERVSGGVHTNASLTSLPFYGLVGFDMSMDSVMELFLAAGADVHALGDDDVEVGTELHDTISVWRDVEDVAGEVTYTITHVDGDADAAVRRHDDCGGAWSYDYPDSPVLRVQVDAEGDNLRVHGELDVFLVESVTGDCALY